jgi:hypothetical protein
VGRSTQLGGAGSQRPTGSKTFEICQPLPFSIPAAFGINNRLLLQRGIRTEILFRELLERFKTRSKRGKLTLPTTTTSTAVANDPFAGAALQVDRVIKAALALVAMRDSVVLALTLDQRCGVLAV